MRISKIHSKPKPFQCSICPKRFHRKADKNRHEKTHVYQDPGHSRINFTLKQKQDLQQNAILEQSQVSGPSNPPKQRFPSNSEPPPAKRRRVVGGAIESRKRKQSHVPPALKKTLQSIL